MQVTTRYKLQVIGDVDQGINGRDQYVLIKDLEDEINLDDVRNFAEENFCYDTNRPGGAFCYRITVVPASPLHNNQCIAIIHHRYDV